MKRLLLAALLTVAALPLCQLPHAQASSWTNRLANVHACPSPWWHHHSPAVIRDLVACEARLFGVSVSHALYVANRESRFYIYAYLNGGCGGHDCVGIFQHAYHVWWGWLHRVHQYAPGFRSAWWNPRTQAVVTIKMVRAGGWGPWGG